MITISVLPLIVLLLLGPIIGYFIQTAVDIGFEITNHLVKIAVGIVFLLISTIGGIGLYLFKNWGRLIIKFYAIVTIVIQTLNFFIGLINRDETGLMESILSVLFFGYVLYMLNQPAVKQLFLKSATENKNQTK